MSDSGFSSGLPPGANIHISQYPPSKAEIKAKLIEIRGPIKTSENTFRVLGKVVKQDKDGTTHVKTDKGDIILKTSPKNLLKAGQNVEIELQIKNGTYNQETVITPKPEKSSSTSSKSIEDKVSLTTPSSPVEKNTPSSHQLTSISSPKDTEHISKPGLKVRLLPINNTVQLDIIITEQEGALIVNLSSALSLNSIIKLSHSSQADQIVQNITLETLSTLPKQSLNEYTLGFAKDNSSHLNFSYVNQYTDLLEAQHSKYKGNVDFEPISLTLKLLITDFNQNHSLLLQPAANAQLKIIPTSITALKQAPIHHVLLPNQSLYPQIEASSITRGSEPYGILSNLLDRPSESVLNKLLLFSQSTKLPTTIHSVQPFDALIENISSPSIRFLSPPQTDESTTSLQNFTKIDVSKTVFSEPLILQTQPFSYQLNAVVIGKTTQELPIISFFNTHNSKTVPYILQFKSPDIDIGSVITFMPLSKNSQDSMVSLGLPSSLAPQPVNTLWPEMADLVKTLNEISPEAFTTLSRSIPNPNLPARLPASVLFFLAALRSGDLSGLLGNKTIEILKKAGKQGLLKKLNLEPFSQSSVISERTVLDWKLLSFPMLWEDNIYKAFLYYKDGNTDSENSEEEHKHTRFVFDLVLSRLGPLQLDGLFHHKRLDLVIRTDGLLSDRMKVKMRKLFADALTNSDLSGELSFQHEKSKFINFNTDDNNVGVSI